MTTRRQADLSPEDLAKMSSKLPPIDAGGAMFESGEFDRDNLNDRLKAGNSSHQHINDSEKPLTPEEVENGNRVE